MLERLIEKKAGWQGKKKKKEVRNGFEVVRHVSRLLLSDLPIWANNTLTWSPAELGYSRRRECSSQKIGKNYTASSTKNEFLQLQRLCVHASAVFAKFREMKDCKIFLYIRIKLRTFRLMEGHLTIPVDGAEPRVKTIKVALERLKCFLFFFHFSSSSLALVLFHKRQLGLLKAVLPTSLFVQQTDAFKCLC